MSFDDTQIGRAPQSRAPRDDVRWVIPPLVHGSPTPTALMPSTPDRPSLPGAPVTAPSPSLPGGYRLGEYVVAEARGEDGPCEMAIVTHAERGSLQSGGKPLPVLPGMTGSGEINVGQRSVLSYLMQPMTKIQQAFQER